MLGLDAGGGGIGEADEVFPVTCGDGFELALPLSDTKQNVGWYGWRRRQ